MGCLVLCALQTRLASRKAEAWFHSASPIREVLRARSIPSCRFCAALPEPQKRDAPGSPLHGLRPCLAIVPVDNAPVSPARAQPAVQAGAESACELESAGPSGVVQVYTLRTHSVVQTLRFSSRVLSVRASCRLLIVALDAQVSPVLQHCLSTLA